MPNTILVKNESISVIINASNQGDAQILLEGQLVIKNAKALKSGLLAALNSSQNLELVFRNIIKMDLAVLQLFVALQKSASRLDKKISIDMKSTDYIKSVMHNSGWENILTANFQMMT